jgi:putative FmdB family regulatory protein
MRRREMPTYEYYCEQCANNFDAVQKFSEAPLEVCPQGHTGVRRVFRPAGIIFKGSGWYIKDSKADTPAAKSSSAAEKKSKGGESSDSSSKSEPVESSKSEPADSQKSESKSEAA